MYVVYAEFAAYVLYAYIPIYHFAFLANIRNGRVRAT